MTAGSESLSLSGRGTEWARRVEDASGKCVLRGRALVLFDANEQQAFVHVPFCPPFAAVPEFACTLDDKQIRCKIGALYAYGARIELKRMPPFETGLQTALEFTAESSS